jgi:hypothetical protein
LVPPWNKMLALASCASVGVALGSSCAIRFSTAGVYGAFDATAGELIVAGNRTGSEYGTSDGVLGCTQPDGRVSVVTALLPAAVAPAGLAMAGAAPAATSEIAAAAATAAADRFPGGHGTLVLFLRYLVALRNGPSLSRLGLAGTQDIRH